MTEVSETPQNNSPINNPNDIQNIEGLLGIVSSEPVNTPQKFWDSIKLDTSGNLWVNINNTWQKFKPYKPYRTIVSNSFDVAALTTSTVYGSGASGAGTSGFAFSSGATSVSFAYTSYTAFSDSAFRIYENCYYSCVLHCEDIDNNASANGEAAIGIGGATVTGTDITFSGTNFIGFRIEKVAGVSTLYAVTSNTSGETFSSALTTLAINDNVELFFEVRGTSTAFNYRKNGVLGTEVILTGNQPSASTGGKYFFVATTNKATNYNNNFQISAVYYEK
jgi:hypothetical protein